MTHKSVFAYDQKIFDEYLQKDAYPLGPRTSNSMREDPKHLLFSLARYKFCSKMLAGKKHILEVGCGDSFGAPIILQTVENLHCIDIEPKVIVYNMEKNVHDPRLTFSCLDITRNVPEGMYDGAFSMDVIEHIAISDEDIYMSNICHVLEINSVCIIGTPNITSNAYASSISREGHINLKSHDSLKALCERYFQQVFLFSMNDEVVHTGFYPMAHFLLALCVTKRLPTSQAVPALD